MRPSPRIGGSQAVYGIDQDPAKAIALHRESAQSTERIYRLEWSYRTVMRVEFYHPGTMNTDELDEFFQAGAADIDTLKTSIINEPESDHIEHRQSLLN